MEKETLRILLVEDSESDRFLVQEYLEADKFASFELHTAQLLSEVSGHLAQHEFDAVLTDLNLSDSSGIETFMHLKQLMGNIPVIILSGLDNEEVALQALRSGAQDYLMKNSLSTMSLTRSIRYAIERKKLEAALNEANLQLVDTLKDLKNANKQIIQQQESCVEKERLKVILQMAGATAHELNQPLTALLAGIDLMQLHINDGERLPQDMERVKISGTKISEIVRKIRDLHRDETRRYVDGVHIINFDQKVVVLMVEDADDYFVFIEELLAHEKNMEIIHAGTIDKGIRLLSQGGFDLVLLDHVLPDGTSKDFMNRMRNNGCDLPVVIVTGQEEKMDATEVINAGAYDYILKRNITRELLMRSISNAMERYRLVHELHSTEDKIARIAVRDALTGLYNRHYFVDILEREIAREHRVSTELVVCMFEIDQALEIEAIHGRAEAEKMLVEVCQLLTPGIRKSDLFGRYDEMTIAGILPGTRAEMAQDACERFRAIVAEYACSHRLTLSIGVACLKAGEQHSARSLLAAAQVSLGSAKNRGGNRVAFDH